MPGGINKFLIDQATNAYLQTTAVGSSVTTWAIGGNTYWAVTPKSGQTAPPAGYIATYDDSAHPYNGVSFFTAPTPTYAPLATLQAEATTAIDSYADGLFASRNGTARTAQANFEALLALRAKQAAGTLSGDEPTQLAALEDVAARNALTNDRVAVLQAWVAAETSQADLTAFLADVGNPPDGLGWPA